MPITPDQYLHGHHDSVLRSHRWRTTDNSAQYLLERLPPGARLLDVGCGPGTITVDLASRVPGGQGIGIDRMVKNVQTGRFERSLSALTAAGALVTAAEIFFEHDSASFGYCAQRSNSHMLESFFDGTG